MLLMNWGSEELKAQNTRMEEMQEEEEEEEEEEHGASNGGGGLIPSVRKRNQIRQVILAFPKKTV